MPGASYTAVSLITDVQEANQDPTGTHYTYARCLKYLNLALDEWHRRTRDRRCTWTLDLVADQVEYSLLGLAPKPIDLDDTATIIAAGSTTTQSIDRVSRDELNDRHPSWRTDPSGWPTLYMRDTVGFDSLVLYPAPSSSEAATVRDGLIVATQTFGAVVDLNGLTNAVATQTYGAVVDVTWKVGAMTLAGVAHSTDATQTTDDLETVCGVAPQWQSFIRDRVMAYCCADLDVDIAQINKAPMFLQSFESGVARCKALVSSGFQSRPAETYRGENF